MTGTKAEASAGPEVAYAYKPSISGSPRQFTLTGDALEWSIGRHRGAWPYREIESVRMTYRPLSMQANRFRIDIRHTSGFKLTIASATWQGIAVVAPQNDAYRAFVTELHRRIAAANGGTQFHAGLSRIPYGIASVLVALLALALFGLMARAVATSAYGGAAFLFAMAIFFGWPFWSFMQRNQPGDYAPEAPPQRVMP